MHKYLGMTIDYSLPGKLIFSIINYIGKMLEIIPENMKEWSASPTAHHLSYIAEDGTEVYQTAAEFFHRFL